MISFECFQEIVVEVLDRDITCESNKNQNIAISSPIEKSLFIVAGPGSGKTTVMVIKILKFIFVDDVKTDEILATTFTRKAADELNSRLLSWGGQIRDEIINRFFSLDRLLNDDIAEFDEDLRKKVSQIDFNQIHIGTLDSITEEVLRLNREPGSQAPVVVEEFVSKSIMTKLLLKENRYNQEALMKYIGYIDNKNQVKSLSNICSIILEIKDRLFYDKVNIEKLIENLNNKIKLQNEKIERVASDLREIESNMMGMDSIDNEDKLYLNELKTKNLDIINDLLIFEGEKLTLKIIKEYLDTLRQENLYDFTMLESKFLKKLKDSSLDSFKSSLKILLVDEYQDTNLLQESIYFEIAKDVIKNKGSLTIVGDDDQSLYRFRGATVDLFTNFPKRAKNKLDIDVKTIDLSKNYRSTKNIVDFCNNFIHIDEKFQDVRVKNKSKIVASNEEESLPILGMFRDNEKKLAKDLSLFIDSLVNRDGFKGKNKNYLTKTFRDNGLDLKKKYPIKLDDETGSASDIAILTYSPKEVNSKNRQLPLYLRKYLSELNNPLEVFNPRGVNIEENENIQVLCGLILRCIDPDSKYQKEIKDLPKLADRNFKLWRKKSIEFTNKGEYYLTKDITLNTFLDSWANRKPLGFSSWPGQTSLIELTYKLITILDSLQNDMEGLVYLEAITKTIKQTGFFNQFDGNIHFNENDKNVERESILESYWNIFIPIAIGGINIDENLLENLPEKMINIMSIHQSKGLEFPLVIVDVGSRFKKLNDKGSFARFPKNGGKSCNLEDELRRYSELGKPNRSSTDRAFDDLIRLYYVAFSRAQDALLIIGLNSSIEGYKVKDKKLSIPNVALGWTRDKEYKCYRDILLI